MSNVKNSTITELVNGLLEGDRRSLSRAITLVESTRTDHRKIAKTIFKMLPLREQASIRIGISGVPGVGKSTFIEALGLHIVDERKKLAVFAVDPSSPKTGGSILGDKTRMPELSRDENAFIRGTPSAGSLGGVARRTRDVVLLAEAAGANVVLIETVGVGQSEFAVSDIVDFFVLLVAPGGGDDLQGIKKGIIELADLVIVTKADSDLIPAAERAVRDYSSALNLLNSEDSEFKPSVISCSAQTGIGIQETWIKIIEGVDLLSSSGELTSRRRERVQSLMWEELTTRIMDEVRKNPQVRAVASDLEKKLEKGELGPVDAADTLFSVFHKKG